MSEVVCNVIKSKIANLSSERRNVSGCLTEIDAKIDGLQEALEAFERNERKEVTSAPKIKRAYKRRAKRAEGGAPAEPSAPSAATDLSQSAARPMTAMPAAAEPAQAVA